MEDSLLPFTSLCHNLTQADLDFLIFVQRNKTGTALCNLSIKNLVCTICPQHHYKNDCITALQFHDTRCDFLLKPDIMIDKDHGRLIPKDQLLDLHS